MLLHHLSLIFLYNNLCRQTERIEHQILRKLSHARLKRQLEGEEDGETVGDEGEQVKNTSQGNESQ
jgi:hypothetical protein